MNMKIEKNTPKLEEFQKLLKQLNKPLNLTEAARYLNLSKSYLYRLTSKHDIPHYKPAGKIIYFMKSELDEWVYANQITAEKNLTNEGN